MFIDKPILRAKAEERTRLVERSQASHSYKSLGSTQNVGHVGLARNLNAFSTEKAKAGSIQVGATAGQSIPASMNETHAHAVEGGGSLRGDSHGEQPRAGQGQSLDGGADSASHGRTASKLDSRALKEFEGAMELRGDRKVQKYMQDHQL